MQLCSDNHLYLGPALIDRGKQCPGWAGVSGDSSLHLRRVRFLFAALLCSALSANILHGQRIRERRRHKASIQTMGREHLEETPLDQMMEPLVKSLEGLLSSTTISMNPDPVPEEIDGGCVYHKRRRTISTSSTATASKLSTLSAVVLTSSKLKKESGLTVTIEDTPEGVFNGLRSLFKNVFAN